MLEGMQAWNSDYHFLYIDVNGNGLLPVEAERLFLSRFNGKRQTNPSVPAMNLMMK